MGTREMMSWCSSAAVRRGEQSFHLCPPWRAAARQWVVIVAITVLFLLVVAFYAFCAPFLGKQVLEYVAIGIYTPMALAVFILYVRCTSINPADPGIMSKFDDGFISVSVNNDGSGGINLP